MNPTDDTTHTARFSSRTKSIFVSMAIIGTLIISGLLIYAILVTPARQPYRDALAQYENVNKANDALNVAGARLNSSTANDADYENSIKTAQQALTALRTENKALSKESVLLSGEGKEAYAPFASKLEAYMDFNDATLRSMLIVRPVIHDCSISTGLEETQKNVASARACAAALKALGDIPSSDYATLVNAYESQYTQLADTLQAIVSLKDPKGADSAQHEVLVNQLKEITNNLSASGTEFSKNFQQHRGEVSPVGISHQLEEYLKSQSRVF